MLVLAYGGNLVQQNLFHKRISALAHTGVMGIQIHPMRLALPLARCLGQMVAMLELSKHSCAATLCNTNTPLPLRSLRYVLVSC